MLSAITYSLQQAVYVYRSRYEGDELADTDRLGCFGQYVKLINSLNCSW